MSNIEWTEKTWNPVVGCTPVSPGCLNCYAATMGRRLEAMGRPEYVGLTVKRGDRAVFTGKVNCLDDRLTIPLRWKKPTRIFVNSMSDLFHESVPFEFIDKVFAVMALCPQHTFQVLTKRPERMAEYVNEFYREGGRLEGMMGTWEMDHDPWHGRMSVEDDLYRRLGEIDVLPNVWLGTSVEDQKRADERIPHLLRCPAAVRFLSCEPLLEPVNLKPMLYPGTDFAGVDWVIVGGESGPNARPCDVAWIRDIVAQCKTAGVPVFVKQLGAHPRDLAYHDPMPMPFEWDDGGENIERWYKPHDKKGGDPLEWSENLRVREYPK